MISVKIETDFKVGQPDTDIIFLKEGIKGVDDTLIGIVNLNLKEWNKHRFWIIHDLNLIPV